MSPPQGERERPVLGAGVEAALVGVAIAAGVGLVRLTDGAGAWRSALAVVTCVAAGHAATAGTARRWRRLALPAGVAAVALVCAWWFAPHATLVGVPTPSTARRLVHLLGVGAHQIHAAPTPLHATAGIRLWIAGGAGLTAVVARRLAEGRRAGLPAPSWALVPTGALFCYTALLSSGRGRLWGALAFVAAAGTLLAVTTGRPHGRGRRALLPAGAVLGAALVVPLALGPALGGMRLDALPFGGTRSASPDGAAPAGAVVAVRGLALVDDLGGVVASSPAQQLFTVAAPVPLYWQAATLTRFDGREWTPDAATAAEVAGRPSSAASPSLPGPAPRSFVSASVVMGELRTRLLPVPPATVEVRGGVDVVLGASGALVGRPSFPGLVYDTLSALPGASVPAAADVAAPSANALAPYLRLPAVPQRVATLARSIVRGIPDARGRAVALADWFRSGRFRYSLHVSPGGADPLETFLFATRTGFCQQFAAAYGVLARLDGLPTRVAVGFTAGKRTPDGLYVVTSADAHAWPEVYLGPSTGWVSMEPTPAAGDGPVAAGVVYGGAPRSAASPSGIAAAAPHGGPDAVTPTTDTVGSTPPATLGLPRPRSGGRQAAGATWLVVGTASAGAALLLAVLGLTLRRRRVGHGSRGGASQLRWPGARPAHVAPERREVVAAWQRAQRALARRGLGRRPHETLAEHAAWLTAMDRGLAEPYAALSALVSDACYGPEDPTAATGRAARQLQSEVCTRAGRRRRAGGVLVDR